ncbi:magnesium/cobalt transporter CorA [Persephonella atlantica]|uniref:Magnesium transport protein CorA n=1 Tax=Persephonella atlantica TaxID=2699429 RepID=A0ABS1GG06_9AQUI|nr:magnesium/cobalt transporter CorA [Persephonella atlantica]MBK3331854.1 magnesium/cobalt transporter CorA [Persephonella atlantica]
MIRLFVRKQHTIKIETIEDLSVKWENPQDVLWIDIISPTDEELKWVSEQFEVEFPSRQETQEIEISSRYFEDEEGITINAYFLITEKETPYNETVTFILKKHHLITVRYKELKTFKELVKKLMLNPSAYEDGYYIMAGILEIRIDTDADTLEFITREISKLGKIVFTGIDITEEILESISFYEEMNMTIRENLIDKQRILSSLLKSYKVPKEVREELRIMIKDVNSLIEYTTFNFERLDYLQNTFLGLLNIQQNQVIKIFTIMSVIFLPPTLIASIYGMNFHFMPELDWKYGYPFAILLMIISALIPLIVFKKKGWL